QCGFVYHIREICTDKPARDRGERFGVDLRVDLDVLQVDFDDFLPAGDIRPVDQYMPIEATWTKEGGIQCVRSVRRAHYDPAAVRIEAVHFDKQRVKRLFALVVAADVTAAARFAERVELIDKDDAGCFLLSLLEHIADASRAHTDEHLDEVGTTQA